MTKTERTMVTLDRAFALIDEMREAFYAYLPAETVEIAGVAGRRLAADVIAQVNMPAYDLCTMDGYAIRSTDTQPLQIVGEAYAGRGYGRLGPREAVYVATGARLPEGADAVLPIEQATVRDGQLTGARVEPGAFVVREGGDFVAGTTLLPKDSLIAPAAAGVFRTAGVARVSVYRKPRVAVIATGDEIRDGIVADANGPMVCAMLEAWGCEPEPLSPVGDDREELAGVIARCSENHDVVITIGGVSVGRMDFVHSVVEGRVVFKGVRVKPGKPFVASWVGATPVFSLPGKPSGSYAAMEVFVRRFLLGDARQRVVSLPVGRDVRPAVPGFDYVVFVELQSGRAQPIGYAGSPVELLPGPEYDTSLLSTTARTALSDGYFIARDPVKAGQPVAVNLSR